MAGSSEATTCPVRKVPEEFRQGLWPSLVTAAALHTFVPPGTEAMSMDKALPDREQAADQRDDADTRDDLETGRDVTGQWRDRLAVDRAQAAKQRRRLPSSVTGPPWRGITRPRVGSATDRRERPTESSQWDAYQQAIIDWEVSALERRLATGDRRRPSGGARPGPGCGGAGPEQGGRGSGASGGRPR